ncbi:MAG: NAD(P)H-hydrate dehydratase [Verrucomicrobia bacterium]|jgi:NAD(P)H-hydrate epimerase|nr:NAD(P)H-hydrate dehydratase [Verrucomicrobiota bacterium]
MKTFSQAHPILSCDQAKEFEAAVLPDESAEWSAMQAAGQGLARMLVEDYAEIRPVPGHLRVLGLIGKGNNGGDALIACAQLLADWPRASVELILTATEDTLRPLAAKALRQLEGRVTMHILNDESTGRSIESLLAQAGGPGGFHICIDGLLGMSFKAPLREPIRSVIEAVNAYESIDLRAAVDLPSGQGDLADEVTFRADFTYATGIVKHPLLRGHLECGRVRYIDLGFFQHEAAQTLDTSESFLLPDVLNPLRRLRPAASDKRFFGHLFIIGGSTGMPGALLMTVKAAVRSGVGLVTVFGPASAVSVLAAQVPEAMWVAWPETASGTLNPRGISLLQDRLSGATAVLAGPGFGRDRNTEMLTQEIVRQVECPVVLDADALRARVMEAAQRRKPHFGPVIVTPHMGEFMRMAKLTKVNYTSAALLDFSKFYGVTTVLKGPNTRICDGEGIVYSTRGGPVLARGGSGDLLAAIIGGVVAQSGKGEWVEAARGVALHGLAAEQLARSRGQVMVHTSELLDYLPAVLRG